MGLVAPSEPAIAGELEVEIVPIVLRDGNRGLDLLLGTGMRSGDLRANGVGGLEAVARQQELDDHGHRKPGVRDHVHPVKQGAGGHVERGAAVDVDHISDMISEIISVPVKDGVFFSLKSVSEIMDEAEYPGVRVSMETMFDGVRTPFKIDISTGDAITPREVLYRFHLMFEERAIEILAYSLETVLAEKLETVISRATTNTRMRDFYDLHILCQLYGGTLTAQVLTDALCATARRRGTLRLLSEAEDVLRELADDPHMRKLWDTYRARYSYASELTWDIVLSSVRQLCIAAGLAVELPEVTLTAPSRTAASAVLRRREKER